MSYNAKPSLRDFLLTNIILQKCGDDLDNTKYFLNFLNLSKNKPINRASNKKNNDYFIKKNSIKYKSEKDKNKNNEDNFKRKIMKITKHIPPLLYPIAEFEIKKSLRYIYDNNNYFKKKNSSKDNLAKEVLNIRKYDENLEKENEHFMKSLSFIIKNKSVKSRQVSNNRIDKKYLNSQASSVIEENSKTINRDHNNSDKIKRNFDENMKKLNDSKISKSQSLSERETNKIKINININNIEEVNKNIEAPKKKVELSTRNKIDLKFIFTKETKNEDKNDNNKNKDKKQLLFSNNTNKNINKHNLKLIDYEYKYDKSLESKIKPKNLIQTFQLNKNKYKIKNNSNNLVNRNYYSNKSIPIKVPQMVEINNFLVTYDTKEKINIKYLSNKYVDYILLKNVINNTEKYYYKINKMYRKQLKEYMKHRINWVHVDTNNNALNNNNESITINFQWKYYSNRLNFKDYKYEQNTPNKKLRMVNVFEKNAEIGNKKNMFLNILSYCDKININVFDLVPLTIIVSNSRDVDYCLEALRDLICFVEKKN